MIKPTGIVGLLDRSLVSGIAWTAVLRWGAQVISWAATFYAVRRLAPSDYGLISMAMVAIGMARMVEDFGMDSILVQDRSIVGRAEARLAGFLIGVGLLLATTFMILAYAIVGFFKEPKLELIVQTLSLLFVFDALQVVPRARLQRELQFQRLALLAFVQVAATSLVLVTAIRSGFGYWSLVLNTLGGAVASTALLFAWHPYKVALPREIRKIAAPLLQGWRILASRIAWYGYTNADQTIVGRFLGKDALGAYSFALTFSSLSLQEVGAVVSRVVPGVFSEVQDSKILLRRYFLLLTEFLALLTFPMAIGLAVTADLIVPLALGPEWSSVTGPMRLLCLYAAYTSSQLLTSHVLMWTGQFRINMWCAILTGVAMPLAFLLAVNRGLESIGWTWVLLFPVLNAPSMYFAFRTIEISVWEWLEALRPAATACILMAGCVLGIRELLPDSLPLPGVTALSVATGALAYFGVMWFGFRKRVQTLIDVVRAVRSGEVERGPTAAMAVDAP